jgi:Fe-S oxidoreductase
MKHLDLKSVREQLINEALKCAYCGFCEPPCPTTGLGPHRGYTPRGRVRLALLLAEGKVEAQGEVLASIYTCTLCGACLSSCPAGIDIVEIVRLARVIASSKLALEQLPQEAAREKL